MKDCRYYGLGMDAGPDALEPEHSYGLLMDSMDSLVTVWTRSRTILCFEAWMLWETYMDSNTPFFCFGHGSSGTRILWARNVRAWMFS